MKFKIILVLTMLISLTGCTGINKYLKDSVYNLKNGGSDEYFAELKNIEIKEKCKNDKQTKITCIQTLLYKREVARQKLNLPKLYEDNSDAKKVYASKSEDYIQKQLSLIVNQLYHQKTQIQYQTTILLLKMNLLTNKYLKLNQHHQK